MAELGWRSAIAGALLIVCSSGCGNDAEPDKGDDDPDRTVGEAPLIADTGKGSTISRPVKHGKRTNTITFGTVLCSTDPDADIVIDEVRYDTVPELLHTSSADATDVPSIGTWFRAIPPPDDDADKYDNSPIAGVRGGPGRLSGEVVPLEEGLPAPIPYDCGEYWDKNRDFPIVELLTVMTVDKRGSVARRTHIDYHVGDDDHTLTIRWAVGFCGTEVKHEACRGR